MLSLVVPSATSMENSLMIALMYNANWILARLKKIV